MARETIYENPNVALSGGEGMVTNLLLIPNTTYQIVWDGDEYTSTAAEVPFDGMTVVAIGDLGLALGAPTGEYPFLIGALPDGSIGYTFTTESGVTSHSLAIYREVEVSGTGIVLKDRDGNPVTHYPTGGIRLPMSDGSTQLFVNADDVPEPVTLTVNADDVDFTDGYMEITPDAGKVLTKVIVEKPANLLAQYVAEGIDIAGIVGELPGGGSVKFAHGKATYSGVTYGSITHNLGVVPDIVFVCNLASTTATKRNYFYWGVSSAFAAKYPMDAVNPAQKILIGRATSVTTPYLNYYTSGIDSGDGTSIFLATETTFRLYATSTYTLNGTYYWVAIGGLT